MGKMKDVFMLYQQEREQREVEDFARREYEYLNSRKASQTTGHKATKQTPPKGK